MGAVMAKVLPVGARKCGSSCPVKPGPAQGAGDGIVELRIGQVAAPSADVAGLWLIGLLWVNPPRA